MRAIALLIAAVAAAKLRGHAGQQSGAQTKDEKPILIITAGPTGAGKSTLMTKAVEAIADLHPAAAAKPFEKFIVDDLVENDRAYKDKALAILNSLTGGAGSEESQADDVHPHFTDYERNAMLREQLTHPTPALVKQFADAYFWSRKNGDCGHPEDALPEGAQPGAAPGGCDAVNDNRLGAAIREKRNIIFETTIGYPDWLVNWVGGDYDIYYAASLVDLCALLQRNKNRAYVQATSFLKDPEHGSALRLPDVTPEGPYPGLVEAFKVNLRSIAHDVLLRCNRGPVPPGKRQFCVADTVRGLVLFDNNSQMKLIENVRRAEKEAMGPGDDADGALSHYQQVLEEIEQSLSIPELGVSECTV